MSAFLLTLFSWPQGIVVGNLIASFIWAAPALLHLHWRMGRHHKAQLAAHHCAGCNCPGTGSDSTASAAVAAE